MSVAKERKEARLKRRIRVRKKIRGTAERPRLCVFRSARHIYAQLIDDVAGRTLAAVSSLDSSVSGADAGNVDSARAIGTAIADKAKAAKISEVVFDRNGFLYHGRVKALAEAAREAGLKF